MDLSKKKLKTLLFCIGISIPAALAAEEPNITWEVANRFSPFEAYRAIGGASLPAATFNAWKFQPGEDYEAWHKRLWDDRKALLGSEFFTSPFAGLIAASAEGSRETELWDPVRDVHKPRVAQLARAKGQVRVVARSSLNEQQCTWRLEGREPETHACDSFVFDSPLEGPPLTLTVSTPDGSLSANAEIEIEHLLIVGLGESYASGQGNPDVPARWKSWSNGGAPHARSVAWLNSPETYLADADGGAKWLDSECYRSFFNYQSLTAFKIASEKPQSFVSFLHYACSGAEIFDGLLNPQSIPDESNRDNRFGQTTKTSWFQARSQLNSLIMDLCEDPGDLDAFPLDFQSRLVTEGSLRSRHAFQRHNSFVGGLEPDAGVSPSMQGDARSYDAQHASSEWAAHFENRFPSDGLQTCKGQVAKPDLILLGIGGNDAGFESIVRFYVTPSGFRTGLFAAFATGEICPRRGNLGSNSAARRACWVKSFGRYDTQDLIEGNPSMKCASGSCRPLSDRLILSFDAIMKVTSVSADRILTPVYPDPFRSAELPRINVDVELPDYAANRANSEAPVLSEGVDGGADNILNPRSQWLGGAVLVPGGNRLAEIRRFDLTRQEAELMLREVESIRSQQRRAASLSRVSLVQATRDAFLSAPWTYGQNGHLPNSSGLDAWDPATWEPYAYEESARSIRTFNDSLLTQQDFDKHADFRGTAHPNLTGHRLLADRIYPCAISIIEGRKDELCK